MRRRAVRSVRRDLDLSGTLFVLGKGGTGKSVVSEGLATLAAEMGRKTLLVRIGETLSEAATKSKTPTPAKHGFDVVDLDARVAMDEYVQNVVRLRPLVERITGSEVYKKFFAAAPGLPELVLLGRIREYALEMDRHQRPRWESLVVDCPSSGHGLLMLETPFAAFRAVSVGPFARLAASIMEWLRTDARIAVVAVPEEMAVVEAIEFKNDLFKGTGLALSLAFLNRMRQETLSSAARLALSEVDAPRHSDDRRLIDCALLAQRRSRLEVFHQRRLTRGVGLQPILIGELPNCRPRTMADELSGDAS